MAQGSHILTPPFNTVDTVHFAVSNPTTPLIITAEDARATYTGALFVSTACTSCMNATVTLSATIQDITAVDPTLDPYAGDIRNAKVTFINRDSNTIIASGLAVGLVNAGDPATGTATYNWNVNITCSSSPCSQTYTIGIIVSGYYTRNASADDMVVDVAQPGTNFITRGGYVLD